MLRMQYMEDGHTAPSWLTHSVQAAAQLQPHDVATIAERPKVGALLDATAGDQGFFPAQSPHPMFRCVPNRLRVYLLSEQPPNGS